jgi:hypothetical protein
MPLDLFMGRVSMPAGLFHRLTNSAPVIGQEGNACPDQGVADGGHLGTMMDAP